MKQEILNIAHLDQVSDVPYPWAIIVAQVREGEKIYYTAEIHHERFIRAYKLHGFTWSNGRVFAKWLEQLCRTFEYSRSYYLVEVYNRDLRFAELWFDRHFMRKREEVPVAYIR